MTNAELDSMILSCVAAGWSGPEIRFGLGGKPWPGPEDPMSTQKIWNRVSDRVGNLRHSDADNIAVIGLSYYTYSNPRGGYYKLELA
jgi:hypothetical protein